MLRWMLGLFLATVVGAAPFAAQAADKEPEGKKLFLKYKCSSCHSIEAAGVVKVADTTEPAEPATKKKPPDLSGVGLEKKSDWIQLFLQKKEKLDGDSHPKKFRGTDKELSTIAAWLETMKTPSAKKEAKEAKEAAEPKKEDKGEKEEKEEKGEKEGTEGAKTGSGESGK